MPPTEQPRPRNHLLASLEDEDYALLEPRLERIELEQGGVLVSAGHRTERLCFPEAGVMSVHDVMEDGSRIGIGIVGCEGFAGWQVLLGSDFSPHETMVAIAGGTALHIRTEAFLEACQESASLKSLMLLFIRSFIIQMSRTIVSNLSDPVERRLARWLLMNQDRLRGEDIELTHQQMGVMLGVRRASVTDALHLLEGEGMIRSRRGCVTIKDRARLRKVAGEAYGFPEAEYSRLIAPFGDG